MGYPAYSIEYSTSTNVYSIPVGKKASDNHTANFTYSYFNATLNLYSVDSSWMSLTAPAHTQGYYLLINFNANYFNRTDYFLCSITYDPSNPSAE